VSPQLFNALQEQSVRVLSGRGIGLDAGVSRVHEGGSATTPL